MIFEPRGPQLEGIRWLVKHAYAGLFWDPGVGKTITVLQAFKILRDKGLVRSMLVTASVNIIEDVWPEEMEKFDDLDLTYAILRGGARTREAEFDLDADVYLINYENLFWLQETFTPKLGIDMFVVDESSKFRNGRVRKRVKKAKSGRTRRNAFSAVVRMLPWFKRRTILTGSPAPRSYLNLWPQAYIMDRGETLGQTLTGYRNAHFYPTGYKGYNWVLREGEEKSIHARLAKRVHRAERDNKVPVTFHDVVVKLPAKAAAAYRELEREFITEWKGKVLLAQHAAVATAKLRQAANGAIYFERKSKEWLEFHTQKVERLIEIIDEMQGSPLLVAYEFEHDYEMMFAAGLDVPKYAGSRQQRAELKKQWDAGELPVLTAQIQAVSHGLNLQYGGHSILYYGMTFDLDSYEQAYQRIWRSGQTKPVRVYHLMARNTVDEVMLAVLNQRSRTQKDLLRALRKRYEV